MGEVPGFRESDLIMHARNVGIQASLLALALFSVVS